jgi:hypothetical protein
MEETPEERQIRELTNKFIEVGNQSNMTNGIVIGAHLECLLQFISSISPTPQIAKAHLEGLFSTAMYAIDNGGWENYLRHNPRGKG